MNKFVAVLTGFSFLVLGSCAIKTQPALASSLEISTTGPGLSFFYFIKNNTKQVFEASHGCMLDLWLENEKNEVVFTYPGPHAGCEAKYVPIDVPAESKRVVLWNRLDWDIASLPKGTYRIRSKLQLFHVVNGFSQAPLEVWSDPFDLPPPRWIHP